MPSWKLTDRVMRLESTQVMGILNVTPDSFSDGGRYATPQAAAEAALAMQAAGAAVIDVGGQSTRPEHTPSLPRRNGNGCVRCWKYWPVG